MADLTPEVRLTNIPVPERVVISRVLEQPSKPGVEELSSIPGGENLVLAGEEKPVEEAKLMPAKLQKSSGEAGEVRFDTTRHDQFLLNDTYDSSRDLVSLVAREGKPWEAYHFVLKMHDLNKGAQNGNLDSYLLIKTGEGGSNLLPDNVKGSTGVPWNLAVGMYDENNYRAFDNNGVNYNKDVLKDVKFDAQADVINFSLDKNVLRQKGWKDGDPLKLQAFTKKDMSDKVTDSLDLPESKPWMKDGKLTAYFDTGAPPPVIEPPDQKDWSKEIIYQIMTDRFRDGDPNNNNMVDKKDPKMYQGGDLQGIIDKMDYIKDLGVTTLWISPTMKNQDLFVSLEGEKFTGYHYYWPVDLYKMDDHQGSFEKFDELLKVCHDNGLKVLLDIPLNHTAFEHPFTKDPNKKDWFHHNGDVKDWENDWQQENCSLFGLPDWNTENPDVKKYLLDVSKFWIDKGIDGFRLDAVRSIPRPFWNEYCREIHKYAGDDFLLIGEYFHGDTTKVAPYQRNDMNSEFDYPLYFHLERVFGEGESMKSLAAVVEKGNSEYEHPEMMSVFADNHDKTRLMTQVKGDKDKFKLALDFVMTVNRIPSIYYGTETGMDGGHPHWNIENRKMMEFDKNPDILEHFKTLTSLRNNSPALQSGKLHEMWVDDQVYAYSRMQPDDEAIVVMNNSGQGQRRDIPLRAESQLKDGTVLKDVLTGEKIKVQNHRINADVRAKSARIFVKDE